MTSRIRLENDVELDEISKKVAETELRETPETVAESTAELRRLLKNDPTLNFDDSDDFLIMMLRPCKFYPQSAYDLMKRIADFRKKHANSIKDVCPESEKRALLETKVTNVLVDRDQHRRRILIMNVGGVWDPSFLSTDDFFRVLYLIHFGATMEPVTQIHGAIIIMDFTDLSRKQAFAFTPSFAMRLLSFIQDAMPLRLKAVHIVFQPWLFKTVIWPIFKSFIRKKLSQRIHFHGSDLASLHKHVDKDCLPEDYGGTKPKIDYSSADWYPVFAEYNETVKTWHSYGYAQK